MSASASYRGWYSHDTPSQNNMSWVKITSPLTHCSVMMVSQLQTISEHALYVFGARDLSALEEERYAGKLLGSPTTID